MAAAASPAAPCKRYVSPVYEDKYFPEKPVAVPFKWESIPGTIKWDDEEDDARHENENGSNLELATTLPAEGGIDGNMHLDQKKPELISPPPDTPPLHAAKAVSSVYPLPPPPKFCPPSPLRVKDLLLGGDDNMQHQHDAAFCPLHAYSNHHRSGFPWLSLIRFRPIKGTNAVVPVHKSFCILEPQHQINRADRKDQASPIFDHVVSNSPLVQARSQSFSYATRPQYGRNTKPFMSGGAIKRATERRCSSFNSLSAPHHTILEQLNEEDNEEQEGQSTMATAAAAAIWAGACILAAAAADHNHLDRTTLAPCRVASKLKDLMQQSANFSELGLGIPLAVCGGGAAGGGSLVPAKRRTKSVEGEVVEAFLEEGMQKSCGVEANYDGEKEERANNEPVTTHHPPKKRKGLLSLLKSECIACWCPSPPF